MWLHSLKVAQLLRSAACLHTNQSRSYLNHLVRYKSLREPDRFRPVWYCLLQCVRNTLYVDLCVPTSECLVNRQPSFTVMGVNSGPSFRNSCFTKEHRPSVPFAGTYRLQLASLKQKRVLPQSYCYELSRSIWTGPQAVAERYRWVGWLDVSRNRG